MTEMSQRTKNRFVRYVTWLEWGMHLKKAKSEAYHTTFLHTTAKVEVLSNMFNKDLPSKQSKNLQLYSLFSKRYDPMILLYTIRGYTFSTGFGGISRLGFSFIFLQWFKLAHICIQVTSLHKWKKQGINHKFLIGNRFRVTLRIVSPIIFLNKIMCQFQQPSSNLGQLINFNNVLGKIRNIWVK